MLQVNIKVSRNQQEKYTVNNWRGPWNKGEDANISRRGGNNVPKFERGGLKTWRGGKLSWLGGLKSGATPKKRKKKRLSDSLFERQETNKA